MLPRTTGLVTAVVGRVSDGVAYLVSCPEGNESYAI